MVSVVFLYDSQKKKVKEIECLQVLRYIHVCWDVRAKKSWQLSLWFYLNAE